MTRVPPRILILQAGSPEDALRERVGDYPDWFITALRRAPGGHLDIAVCAPDREPLPDMRRLDGVLMTGSPRSVTAPEPWMDAAATYMLRAAERIPVLGICFGHQLLGKALGGEVERNPAGYEVGTHEIQLTPAGAADPLFAGVPSRFLAQQTHEDHVPALPPGCVLLATSSWTPVQAFGHGPRLRCLQFHPEMGEREMTALVEVRGARLDQRVVGGAAKVRGSLAETRAASRTLSSWVRSFVRGG